MKIVLCEGKDEVDVLAGLCAQGGISALTIREYGGRNNLGDFIEQSKKLREFANQEVESLAILMDADDNAGAAWQRMRDVVRNAFGVELPEPGVFGGESPRIAAFVIAGEDGKGMLETVCLEAVSSRPEYECLEEYFRCLAEKTEMKTHHPKQRFHAWLASQTKELYRTGEAARREFVPYECPAFDRLREFLRSV